MEGCRGRFEVRTERSALLIEARSNVGPIAFGTTSLEGFVELRTRGGAVDLDGEAPVAVLQFDMTTFSSGNSLYDAELFHRIDARRHPTAALELTEARRIGSSDRFGVEGDLTFHGITRQISGAVSVKIDDDEVLHVAGENRFDIRDFGVAVPTVLMLRIYPDVRIELQLEARRTP